MGVVRALGFAKVPFFRVQEDFFATIFWVFPVKRAFSRGKTRGSVKSQEDFLGVVRALGFAKVLFFSSSGGLCYNFLGFSSQEGLFSWENKGFCEVRRTFWVLFER